MAQTTIEQFAAELGLPTALLLEQLKSAGVVKSTLEDKLQEADKTALLEYLRKEHGAAQAPKSKITLTRKSNSEIKKTDSMGKARTIQVEVRKKRVLERNETEVEEPVAKVEPLIEVAVEPVPEVQIEEIIQPKNKSDERKLRIKGYLTKARSLLPDHTEAALNTIRKALEAIVQDIIESKSGNIEYIKKFNNFEDQLSHVRRIIKLPKIIDVHFRTLQSFGNFGSHHQEDELTHLSIELVEINLSLLGDVIDWHNNLELSKVTNT